MTQEASIEAGLLIRLKTGNVIRVLRKDGEEWVCEYTRDSNARGEIWFCERFLLDVLTRKGGQCGER